MPWAPDNQEIPAVFERVADLLGVGERLERHGWSFTAMFSNTARAHALAKTGDCVVLRRARR